MNQQQIIEQLVREHHAMEQALSGLSPDRMRTAYVFDEWTVKDIVAHIAAWHWTVVQAIDDVLDGRAPWFASAGPDAFNQREVARRRDTPVSDVLEEWHAAFAALIDRVRALSAEEWRFAAPFTWGDGQPITVRSLFEYEYEGVGHEGGHARQIAAWMADHNLQKSEHLKYCE